MESKRLRFIARDKDGMIVDILEAGCTIRKDGISKRISDFVLELLVSAGEGGRVEIEDMEE